jgi:outer membrane protein assembly factor BamB
MKAFPLGFSAWLLLSLLWIPVLHSEKPPQLADLQGGLVVQVGAEKTDLAVRLSHTGRYLVHLVDLDSSVTEKATKSLRTKGTYGLAFAETLQDFNHLPYAENMVNAVILQSPGKVPLAEVHRILTPGGVLLVDPGIGIGEAHLKAAGFDTIKLAKNGTFDCRKPWPKNMDDWSHPRHAANGNAVSGDTAVGPPERVRWVAAATSEVEGLVTAGGRNFYGGILARDSFNGLRLWHRDLLKSKLNEPSFNLPRLSYSRARPVVSGKYIFAAGKGKLVALDAATGEIAREYPGIGEPDEVIHHKDVVIAIDENQIRAFSSETAEELWERESSDPRNLTAENETVCFIRGRPKRGEPSEAIAVDLNTGKVKWQASHFSWMNKVYRTVMHGEHVAFEVSTLNDHDAGNGIHVLSAKTGKLAWEKDFPPGMNHTRQARAMFAGDDIWILHGGKQNTATKEGTKRTAIQVSSLNPATGKVMKTFPAGLAHCFPPVATPRYVFAGVLDMTDMKTGDVVANRITKANCSRENGWVPANGLIYTTPKHCTCWPMLRGYVAMAPASPARDSIVKKPIEEITFTLSKGSASADSSAPSSVNGDWPTYRGDPWRSGSSAGNGPTKLETKWSAKVATPSKIPDGPILHDWDENPFVKGPVSAPTISGDRVFVTRPDAHEVLAMQSADGKILWRFTARGRVDTPPTIHSGLALFGCHAGYVYALRVDTGEMAWEFQAAPVDERIVAYGQVESPWPVPGAVLVIDATVYFVAGRQQLADGGVLVFALDALTGEKRWVHRLDHIPQTADPTGKNPYKGFYENSGLEFDPIDILHQEGDGIAMSRWIFSPDGKTVDVDKWNAFAKLDTGGGEVWVPRGSWNYGARHQDRFPGESPRRPLVVFRDSSVFGQLNASTDVFRRDFDADAVKNFNGKWITGWKASQEGRKGGKPFRTYRVAEGAKWTVDPFTPAEEKDKPYKKGTQLFNDVHAMALAGNDRLYAVHKDGRLKVFDTSNGKVLAERQVPSPIWDGLAIAKGNLFLSTRSGELLCLGAAQ